MASTRDKWAQTLWLVRHGQTAGNVARDLAEAGGHDLIAGLRVLIVAHQVIVNRFRYLLKHLDEAQILAADRQADVPNCSVTACSSTRCKGRTAACAGTC